MHQSSLVAMQVMTWVHNSRSLNITLCMCAESFRMGTSAVLSLIPEPLERQAW